MLGDYKMKMGWSKATELTEDALRNGLLGDGGIGDGEDGNFIRILVESSREGMVGEYVWSFEDVGGLRRYVRRLCVRKGDNVEMVKSVYDYVGKV